MPDISAADSGITSPQDLVAILEDLVAFHVAQNVSTLASLQHLSTLVASIPADQLALHQRLAACAEARAIVTRTARELATANACTDATFNALHRSSFVVPHPAKLS